MKLIEVRPNRFIVYDDNGFVRIITSYKTIANHLILDSQASSKETETDSQSPNTN